MQPEVTLTLTIEEVNGILNVLAELPTKSGAYPLMVKIKAQGAAQTAPAEAPKED